MGYETSRIAIDIVVFTIHENQLKVYLNKREKEPCIGKFELPGGLLRNNETAEETLSRKIKETIGNEKIFFQQFYTFTDPKRDPRQRTVSIGFIALVNFQQIKDFSKWHNINYLKNILFDHKEIIMRGYDYLKKEIDSLIVKQFLPNYFSFNRLQDTYEIILREKFDNRNFRRKMINSGVVEETKKLQTGVSHRPAKLYRFKVD